MNNKKIIAGIMAFCLMGGVMPSIEIISDNAVITANAEDYTEGTYEQLTYIKYSDHIEISGCDKSATEVVIPAEIEGMPVTSIGYRAFSLFYTLTSVTIPDSITNIGDYAFFDCYSLKSVTIPDSVTSIGDYAFFDCSDLTSVTIPDNVTNIGNYAFSVCKNLTSITISDSVMNIGTGAFSTCKNLISVTILNPECDIYDSTNTISNGYDDNKNQYYNGTIYGYENSTAQAYAEKYGYKFELIGEAVETSTGDVDGDGIIDANDASFVLAEYTLLSTGDSGTFTESMKKSADINKDGQVDSVDASLILSYYAYTSTGGTDEIEKFLESSDI